jgi:hypothetical protein
MVGDGAFEDSDEDSTNEEMKSDTVEEGYRRGGNNKALII